MKKFSNFAMHKVMSESQSVELDEFHTCELPVAAICERDHGGSRRKTKREQHIHVATNLFSQNCQEKDDLKEQNLLLNFLAILSKSLFSE